MSSTGKARPTHGLPTEIRRIQNDLSALYGYRRTLATPTATQYPQLGSGTSNVTNSQSYLKTAGDTMVGPFALANVSPNGTTILNLSGGKGHLNIASTSRAYSSNVIVNVLPAGSAMSFIDGATFDGQILKFHVLSGQTLTVNTDGNIVTTSGNPVSFTGPSIIEFMFNSTLGPNLNAGGWEIASSTTGSGSVSSGANVFLSNLSSPTAINQDLLPAATATYRLGNPSIRWKDVVLSEFLYAYEGSSSNQYLQIFKDTGNHYASYNFNDVANNNLGHAFYVNGGSALLQIQTTYVRTGTDLAPLTDTAFNLGTASFRWGAGYIQQIWNCTAISPNTTTPNILVGHTSPVNFALIRAYIGVTPSTTDIPAGYFTVVRDTSDGSTKLYYNDGGTFRKVTLA